MWSSKAQIRTFTDIFSKIIAKFSGTQQTGGSMDNSFDVTDTLSKGKKVSEAEKNKVI